MPVPRKAFSMVLFFDKWGRTGFDGDSSVPWSHAELDDLVKLVQKTQLRTIISHWLLN